MSIRVVLADDQAVVRAGFRTILEAEPDITVVGEAGNGEGAVAEARRLRPDLVLMDVRMPGTDGIAATERLAGPAVPDPVPVLVVTTFDLDEYVFAALRGGASGFLLKDVEPDELVDAVRTVADGQGLVAPRSPAP
jgi:DNA-binding NarL/FixJ family response regulator